MLGDHSGAIQIRSYGYLCRSWATLNLGMVALEGELHTEVEMQTPRASMVGINRRATPLQLLAMASEEGKNNCTYMIQHESYDLQKFTQVL